MKKTIIHIVMYEHLEVVGYQISDSPFAVFHGGRLREVRSGRPAKLTGYLPRWYPYHLKGQRFLGADFRLRRDAVQYVERIVQVKAIDWIISDLDYWRQLPARMAPLIYAVGQGEMSPQECDRALMEMKMEGIL